MPFLMEQVGAGINIHVGAGSYSLDLL